MRQSLFAAGTDIMRSIGTFFSALAIAALPFVGASDASAQGRTIWEGFHVGGHIGHADTDYGITQTNPASGLVTTDDDGDGVVGGVVYGNSWQFNNWVLGTDSAITFGDTETGLNTAANGLSATAEVEWSSETRARAGVLVNPNLLLYGTAGIAFATVEVNGSLIANNGDDERVFGAVYGGGIETTLGNRVFARVEYLHYDFDDEKFGEVGGGTFNVDMDSDVVRGAIGYRFDWSPMDLFTGGR